MDLLWREARFADLIDFSPKPYLIGLFEVIIAEGYDFITFVHVLGCGCFLV